MAAPKMTLFSLSPQEIVLHVDGDDALPFQKTFRGHVVILTAAIMALSWFMLGVVLPAVTGKPLMSSGELVMGMLPYLILTAFVFRRHRWAMLAWGAYFAFDQVATMLFLTSQTSRLNPGSLIFKAFLVIYALSLAWKAFLVERELRRRASAPAVPAA